MAKFFGKRSQRTTGIVITTKTAYGSTSDMIVSDFSKFENPPSLETNEVVLKDDVGYYITTLDRVDSGIADPNRYGCAGCRVELVEKAENAETSA